MATEHVEQQIRRFLETAEPETLCVRGAWGVGKTFIWNYVLRKARDEQKIKLDSYSYVSLFGLNSIEELKYAIFENRIPLAEIGKKATFESLERNARTYSRAISAALSKLPIVGGYFEVAAPLLLLTIAQQIVCIDDLERKGSDLEVREVFGLVSFLKEQRDCKVVLLSNTSELRDQDKEQFDAHLEKVVDEALTFEPTPQYCAEIALTDDQTGLAKKCVALGISNIRIIKRIQRLVDHVQVPLRSFRKEVLDQAVHTLAILGWIKFSKETAPPLQMLHNRLGRRMMESVGQKKKDEDPKEAAWNALIDNYGFADIDDFDAVLLDGVEHGYFDEERLKEQAEKLSRSFEDQEGQNAQRAAWRMFHDSFDDNGADVASNLFAALKQHISHVSITNLNGAMTVLKELGQREKATELLAAWVQSRQGNPQNFDLDRGPFRGEVNDPELVVAFAAAAAEQTETREPIEILLKLAEDGGSEEDYAILDRISVEDILAQLKSRKGDDLRALINACIGSDRIINARDVERQVSARAKEALARIGATSDVNALRVSRFGVGPKAQGGREEQ